MTKAERRAIIAYIADTNYDAATVRISRDGNVSAKLDPNKVPGCHDVRLLVGYAPHILEDIAAAR